MFFNLVLASSEVENRPLLDRVYPEEVKGSNLKQDIDNH